MTSNAPAATGRGWAYFCALLGGGVSVAANVQHTYLITSAPPVLAVIISVFWPVALFGAIELLARVAWKSYGRHVGLLRWGIAPIATVAAVVSYRHMSGLLAFYGEDPVTVALGPIAVDGLMLVATGALIVTSRRRGVAVDRPAVAVAPPVAGRVEAVPAMRPAPTPAFAPAIVVPTSDITLPPPPGGRPMSETRRLAEDIWSRNPRLTQQQVAELLGISRRTLRDALAVPAPVPPAPRPAMMAARHA